MFIGLALWVYFIAVCKLRTLATRLEQSICVCWDFVGISHLGLGKDLIRLSVCYVNVML